MADEGPKLGSLMRGTPSFADAVRMQSPGAVVQFSKHVQCKGMQVGVGDMALLHDGLFVQVHLCVSADPCPAESSGH
eukprot:11214786-Lingulodinium_polyedra.AAC.1